MRLSWPSHNLKNLNFLNMDKTYIWTNHALKRLSERKITGDHIREVLTRPDHTSKRSDNAMEIRKIIDGTTFATIIKRNHMGEYIIISCWANPPFPGTKDYKKRQRYLAMQKAPLMKKLWLIFLTKIGL